MNPPRVHLPQIPRLKIFEARRLGGAPS